MRKNKGRNCLVFSTVIKGACAILGCKGVKEFRDISDGTKHLPQAPPPTSESSTILAYPCHHTVNIQSSQ